MCCERGTVRPAPLSNIEQPKVPPTVTHTYTHTHLFLCSAHYAPSSRPRRVTLCHEENRRRGLTGQRTRCHRPPTELWPRLCAPFHSQVKTGSWNLTNINRKKSKTCTDAHRTPPVHHHDHSAVHEQRLRSPRCTTYAAHVTCRRRHIHAHALISISGHAPDKGWDIEQTRAAICAPQTHTKHQLHLPWSTVL